MARLLCRWIRLDLCFHLIYRSRLCYVSFRSYYAFSIAAPSTPGAAPTAQPLRPILRPLYPQVKQSLTKGQSIFGVKIDPASAVSEILPLPFYRVSFGSDFGCPDALTFYLGLSFLLPSVDGASSRLLSEEYCSFVGAASPPLCLLQGRAIQDGRALGRRLSARVSTLEIFAIHSGSFLAAPKWLQPLVVHADYFI